MINAAPFAVAPAPALLRWTHALDRVLPPRGAFPAGAASQMRADARCFRYAAEGSVWRRSLVDVRQAVVQSAAALPRGPRLTTQGQGLPGTLAATANLLAAALGCGARLAIALLVSLAAAPAGLVLALGRAVGLGRPPVAPPVLDWRLDDDAQRAALHRRYTDALQLKVSAGQGGQQVSFAQTQLGKDVPRHPDFLSMLDERKGGFVPEPLVGIEARLRALADDHEPWFRQLAALASQSAGNSLAETFLVGIGWRRVGGEIFAPGEGLIEMGAANFFACRDAFRLHLVRPRADQSGDVTPYVRLEASLTWSPEASAGAWRNICTMDRLPEPRTRNFSPQGLQLDLSFNLLRPEAREPNVVQLQDVRLSVRPNPV